MWHALLIFKKIADFDSLDLFHDTLMGCNSQFKKIQYTYKRIILFPTKFEHVPNQSKIIF